LIKGLADSDVMRKTDDTKANRLDDSSLLVEK